MFSTFRVPSGFAVIRVKQPFWTISITVLSAHNSDKYVYVAFLLTSSIALQKTVGLYYGGKPFLTRHTLMSNLSWSRTLSLFSQSANDDFVSIISLIFFDRTHEELAAARARGRKGGRRPIDKEAVRKAVKLYKTKQYTISEITELTGVRKTTLYKNLHE